MKKQNRNRNELQKIKSMIYKIRGYQVILDADLAKIYQVETRILNQAVKRNIDRFPSEFMFRLTQAEYENLMSQFVTSKDKYEKLRSQFVISKDEYENLRSQFAISKDEYENLRSQFATSKDSKGGRRYLPFAFTEHGIIMLSSVLNSKIATKINIAVVKAFIEMKRYIANPIRKKLDELEKVLMLHIDDTNHNLADQAAIINEIITKLNNLIKTPPKQKRKIGFNPD